MSYFSQMAGLAVQNFISAGVGIAVLVAFVRALASRSGKEIGVFYVDLTPHDPLRAAPAVGDRRASSWSPRA